MLSPFKVQVYLKLPPYYIYFNRIYWPIQNHLTNEDGFVTFEQSNREHDQITIEERHARLRNMVNLTN